MCGFNEVRLHYYSPCILYWYESKFACICAELVHVGFNKVSCPCIIEFCFLLYKNNPAPSLLKSNIVSFVLSSKSDIVICLIIEKEA